MNTMLGIRPKFVKLMENDVPTDPSEAHVESVSEGDEIEEEAPIYIGGEPILPGPED